MNGFTFRPAVREAVSLLIGYIGPSGGGKTYTAMRTAKGICGDKPFAVIDTEAGRAKHYANLFRFDHGDLKPPFKPDAYAEAIKAADEAGYKAIIVDSFSHEWAGEGGILEWQENELSSMVERAMEKREGAKEWELREIYKMSSWIKPKTSHKHMIQRLLQIRANLILCFRAEEKIAMEKNEKGKTIIIAKGFQPICSKEMPYELTVSFLLTPDKPGFPQPIKLQEQHKILFPLDRQINEESGKKISEWAAGCISKDQPIPEKVLTTEEEDTPSTEEEKKNLEERGMIPTDEKANEATTLNEMGKEIAKFTTKKELNQWYIENRKSFKGKYSDRFFFEWTKLVNDKLGRLK